ncbi:MAG: hypothetical protein J6V74_00725, partial [Bacteroidales bacterium]|nr:hypothetical protein [Bacteroidales bacterium]
MADITNGGSVPFSSGRTETVYGCSGETFEISVTCLNGTFLQIQNDGSGFTLTDWSSTSSNGVSTYKLSGTFSSEAGTYPVTVYDEFDQTSSMTLNFKVGTNMADPTITVSGVTNGSYIVGETYDLLANTTAEEVDWWVYPEGNGYEFVGEREAQSTALKFTEAGDYTIRLNAYNNYGACTKSVDLSIAVNAASSQQNATYTAPEQVFCGADDGPYVVIGGDEPITSTLYLKVGTETFSGSPSTNNSGGVLQYIYVFNLSAMIQPIGTYDVEVIEDGKTVATGKAHILGTPDAPTITSSEQTFSTGVVYDFSSNSQSTEKYLWKMTQSAGDESYEFVGGSTSSNVQVMFNEAGGYELTCEISNNCFSASGKINVEVSNGATQVITYTALNATLCRGDNMAYTIMASESIPSTTTLKMTVGLESFTGYSKGDSYTFDLSGMTPTSGTFNAEIVDITNGTTIATPTITVNASPYVVISSTEQSFSTGTSYEFTATSDASNGTYMWSMGTYPDGGTYEFVNGYSSQSTTIKFNTAGQYELWCAVTDANGCSSNNFTYVTVEEGSSTPVTVTNGGSVTFVPGSSATLVGCVGEYPYVSFEGENLNLAQPQSGSGSGQANFSEGSYNSFTFEFVSAGTYYFNIYPVGQENDIMVLNLQINEKPDVPTITSSDDTFLAGQTYTFTANTSSQDVTYEWTLSGLPYDGASIDGSNTEKTVSVVFNSALQPGQGTFTLYCEVTSNGCSAIGQKNIEMSSGTTQQDITYTATPQTFCYGDEAEFVVKASQEVEEDYYIMVLLSNSSFYGSHRSDAIDGDEIYFRLNDLPAAEYEVMIYSSDSLNLLVESATMTVGSPIRPTISYDEGEFNVGETVSFFNENYVAEDVSYTWSVDNRDHTFVGATNGETTSIQFLGAENYTVKCQAMDDNGCTSYDTYSLEVENPNPTAVCSINGTTYNSLKTALQAVQSGDEITILDNIYESANYVEKNRTFTINTNGKTVNFGVIIAMANVTITGGGVVTTTLDNSNTNGSDVLTVDGATLNLDGSQWMAKNVAVVHGGNLTLMNDIFLGGGDEDGFNLTIDDTSSFNINGKHISAYNNERVAAQIRPYLPSGYTVDDNLNFSPDANVTLQMPTITYTAEAQLFCEEWSGAVYEYVVTASQSLPQKDYILVAGGKSFHSTPVEDTIKFQLQYLGEADTYDVTLLNADSTTVLAESTVTIYAADVQEPTNVEIVHLEEYNYEKYELNVPYTYTVTNPIEGYEYSWEITYYGGDNNFAADPEDYIMETNSDNTIMTVTFLHSGDYRVEFWDRTCNSGSEMSVYIPAVYTAEPQTFYDSDNEYTYSVAVSQKVWDEEEEFILVVGDKSFHTFGEFEAFSLDFTLSGLEAGTYDNVTMYDTDSANVLAGPTTIEVVPVVCNNTNLTYTYNEDSKNYTSVRESVIPYAAAGDEFVVAWTGTADFTGQLGFALIDRSEEANWWRIVSDWESVPVERGTEFTISKTFTIADSVTSAPNIAFFSTIDIVAGNPTICESELSFTKLCKNLTLEGSNSVALAYLDETVAASDIFHYHIKGTSGFSGEALLSFADVSEAAGYWDALSESKTISV